MMIEITPVREEGRTARICRLGFIRFRSGTKDSGRASMWIRTSMRISMNLQVQQTKRTVTQCVTTHLAHMSNVANGFFTYLGHQRPPSYKLLTKLDLRMNVSNVAINIDRLAEAMANLEDQDIMQMRLLIIEHKLRTVQDEVGDRIVVECDICTSSDILLRPKREVRSHLHCSSGQKSDADIMMRGRENI